MSDPTISSTDALDAVEEKLNLKKQSAPKVSSDEKNEKNSDEVMKDSGAADRADNNKSSLINRARLKLKNVNFSGIKDKLHLDDAGREKLKRFATSNIGITSIVLLIVVLFIGINVARHHHASSSASTSTSQWNAPVSHKKAPVFSQQTLPQKISGVPAETLASTAATSGQIKSMMQTLTDLSDQMKSLNQRIMVISEQLAKGSHHTAVNKNYRILGWRLDQDTNQWVADIEYDGQVKAYYAGQHFGKWVVRNVTANGVKIR